MCIFFFSSRRRHTRCLSDWSSDVCSSDLVFSLIADPQNTSNLYVGSDIGVFVSIDRGATWARDDNPFAPAVTRSEERRVGKEGRSRWWQEYEKEKRSAVSTKGTLLKWKMN